MEVIEPATADDIPALADLLALLFSQEADFRPDRQKQIRGLRMILDTPAVGQIFVVRSNAHVVGMVSLLFTISTAEGSPACWLEDMVVRPDFRAMDRGKLLLTHSLCKAQGITRITC